MTPYQYGANNPILFIDINGDSIVDSQNIVSGLKSYLNNLITMGNQMIKKGTLPAHVNSADFQGVLNEYQTTLNEISVLEKSDQIYNVTSAGTGQAGSTTADPNTGDILISVDAGTNVAQNAGLAAHELKHGYQFEKGKVSFDARTGGAGSLYDITDEVEAYNRQSYVEYGIAKTTHNKASVISFGNSKGINYSTGIPQNNRTLRTKEGRALRKATKNGRATRSPVKEIYRNWKKDYIR